MEEPKILESWIDCIARIRKESRAEALEEAAVLIETHYVYDGHEMISDAGQPSNERKVRANAIRALKEKDRG